ncbi:hypothetical protein [Alkalicoccus urumqiensis]|uniref:hypothetical protein n=1 Tax=Alkalicoccus urumqiensis TaxID=1548213 RepID=UPI0015E5BDE7|nr:hypothetical protein [Alkalicoccus urumqiensis]
MLSFNRIGRDHHYLINIVSAINPSYFTSILLRFESFGRDAGGIRSSFQEAWLPAAPLMLYSRANSARLKDKPTQASAE